jgi:hypothetical protein
MKREQAESTVAYIYSGCKEKVEKAIKDILGVDTCLEFEITHGYGGYHVIGRDELTDLHCQMTATPLLRQLFERAWLEITVGDDFDVIAFRVSVRYDHQFDQGSNGRDLMVVFFNKKTGEVTIIK